MGSTIVVRRIRGMSATSVVDMPAEALLTASQNAASVGRFVDDLTQPLYEFAKAPRRNAAGLDVLLKESKDLIGDQFEALVEDIKEAQGRLLDTKTWNDVATGIWQEIRERVLFKTAPNGEGGRAPMPFFQGKPIEIKPEDSELANLYPECRVLPTEEEVTEAREVEKQLRDWVVEQIGAGRFLPPTPDDMTKMYDKLKAMRQISASSQAVAAS